jgi:ABC-2 type transport system permease protein
VDSKTVERDRSAALRRLAGWPGQYWMLIAMWIRSALAYPASFAMMTVSFALITGLDFVAVILMFSHIDSFGGFALAEMALLYGTAAMALGIADLVLGSIERIGDRIRAGDVDVWLIRPVSAFVQGAADNFALRRVGKPVQATVVLVLAFAAVDIDWTVAKGIVLAGSMLTGAVIFGSIFVLGGAFQFIAQDAAEVANSFTYGGQQLTQYPLTIFGREVVKAVTFVIPVAFANYYPVLYVLGKPAPLGLPHWIGLLAPVVAVLMAGLAAVGWRAGVRRYRSTGS